MNITFITKPSYQRLSHDKIAVKPLTERMTLRNTPNY